jgi:hypothetical protein
MITPAKIIPQVIEHFTPEDVSLGHLNEYECLDLRTKITQQKITGYYLVYVINDYNIKVPNEVSEYIAKADMIRNQNILPEFEFSIEIPE